MIYFIIEWFKAVVMFYLGLLHKQTDRANARIYREIDNAIATAKRLPKLTVIYLPVALLVFELFVAMVVADNTFSLPLLVIAGYTIDLAPTVAMIFVFLMGPLVMEYCVVMGHRLLNEESPVTMKDRYKQDSPVWAEYRALASIVCNFAGWLVASVLIWNLEFQMVFSHHVYVLGFGLGLGGLLVGYMAYVTVLPQIRDYISTPVPVPVPAI